MMNAIQSSLSVPSPPVRNSSQATLLDLYELDEEYFTESVELNEAEKPLNEELD
jgi:vesicle coat complex subunit